MQVDRLLIGWLCVIICLSVFIIVRQILIHRHQVTKEPEVDDGEVLIDDASQMSRRCRC